MPYNMLAYKRPYNIEAYEALRAVLAPCPKVRALEAAANLNALKAELTAAYWNTLEGNTFERVPLPSAPKSTDWEAAKAALLRWRRRRAQRKALADQEAALWRQSRAGREVTAGREIARARRMALVRKGRLTPAQEKAALRRRMANASRLILADMQGR